MENSKIEWTDHTFNPWHGCMKVSEGCKNCYAEKLDHRWKGGHWGPGSPRKGMSDDHWKKPFLWNEKARQAGVKAKVFCASMADVFEDHPDVMQWRDRLFMMIADTPNLIWQLLTKRPENILKFVPTHWKTQEWPSNVWVGTSVENQKAADDRIPILLQVPAKVRFLSCEPLLGPVDLSNYLSNDGGPVFVYDDDREIWPLEWVICGGESGHGSRPMHPDWARSLRDQCNAANVPFFFKQWGEWAPTNFYSKEKNVIWMDREMPNYLHTVQPRMFAMYGDEGRTKAMQKIGKKASGNLLDGIEHKEFPQSIKQSEIKEIAK